LVGEGTSGMVGGEYAVQTVVNGGSELLIFVPRAAHSTDLQLSLSLVVGSPLPTDALYRTVARGWRVLDLPLRPGIFGAGHRLPTCLDDREISHLNLASCKLIETVASVTGLLESLLETPSGPSLKSPRRVRLKSQTASCHVLAASITAGSPSSTRFSNNSERRAPASPRSGRPVSRSSG